MNTRRAFLKHIAAAGLLAPLARNGLAAAWAGAASAVPSPEDPDFTFRHGTLSVSHFPRMQEFIDDLAKNGALSDHPVYRGYIEKRRFAVPEDFPEAKHAVVVAVFTRMMIAPFRRNGKLHELVIPPQYSESGVTLEHVQAAVEKKIIGAPGYRVQPMRNTFLKHLAVRSGLAEYGRNNISYVDGMGSFVTLYGFFTDYPFEGDGFRDLRAMDRCATCGLCAKRCPTKAIREDRFVIDAGRCVTLYNEIDGAFPEWIPAGAHDALMGCMRCQGECPANAAVVKLAGRLEEVTEEETAKILDGKPDDALIETLSRKLRDYGPATSKEQFPIFTRNLRALVS